jgi:hypothetical protein
MTAALIASDEVEQHQVARSVVLLLPGECGHEAAPARQP